MSSPDAVKLVKSMRLANREQPVGFRLSEEADLPGSHYTILCVRTRVIEEHAKFWKALVLAVI